MVAKRPLRDGLREARSVVWLFHSSDNADRSQRRFPTGFHATGPSALLRALAMTTGIARGTRRAPHNPGQWTQKRDPWKFLRPLLDTILA